MSIMLPDAKITAGVTCDQCCAKAGARAWSGGDELFFCGHHLRKNLVALAESGWNIAAFPTTSEA